MLVAAVTDTGLIAVIADDEAMEHAGATYSKPDTGHHNEEHESDVPCSRG